MMLLIILVLISLLVYYYTITVAIMATGISTINFAELTHLIFLNEKVFAESVFGSKLIFAGYIIGFLYILLVWYSRNSFVAKGYYSTILYRSSVKNFSKIILVNAAKLLVKTMFITSTFILVMVLVDISRDLPVNYDGYTVIFAHYLKLGLLLNVVNICYNYIIVLLDREVNVWVYISPFVFLFIDFALNANFILISGSILTELLYSLVYLLAILFETFIFSKLIKMKL